VTRPGTQHAVVIGAGIGGLMAGRVLADTFERVTVLERDVFPAAGEHRKGVPQGRHVHGMLAKGREVLDELFPGLMEDLLREGALMVDALASAHRYIGQGYYCHEPSKLQSLLVSRPLLEALIRQRLAQRANVRILSACTAVGLVGTDDRKRVTGVRLSQRDQGEHVVHADLVVDTSGRGSRAPAWLEAWGYPRPEAEEVRAGVVYVSRLYRRDPAQLGGAAIVQVLPSAGVKRGGFAVAQERDRWIVTVAGYAGDAPTADDEGFVEFVKSLPAPEIYEVVSRSEPLGAPLLAKLPASVRRHYQRLTRFPAGLLVMADAVCAFNPIYGQGMTVAILEAEMLRRELAKDRELSPLSFFRELSAIVDRPWSITVRSDRRFANPGHTSKIDAAMQWYMDRLHRAAQRDVAVALAFLRVTNMVAPPKSVLHPRILARVLWGNLRPRA
jgi:2-polyprenyl-6-methoxyphenol hydroxylase-like FAD-dependent oxidoreductase